MARLLGFIGSLWLGRRFASLLAVAHPTARARLGAGSLSPGCTCLAHTRAQRGFFSARLCRLVHVVSHSAPPQGCWVYPHTPATVLVDRHTGIAGFIP